MPLLFRRLHEALDRNTAAFERNEQAFLRNEQAFQLNEQAFQDLQVVIREERLLMQRSIERFEAFVDRINADAAARMDAVQKMLDRWGEGPTPAS